jgi:hypothetical protein
MKLKAKAIVPLFIALIFIGSIFVVFTQGGSGKPGNAELTINFGQPNMVDQQKMNIAGNMTALELLSSYANYVSVDAGNVKCIGSYCNTNRSAWKFYANDAVPIENTEHYVVKDKDQILFRYEEIKRISINETV